MCEPLAAARAPRPRRCHCPGGAALMPLPLLSLPFFDCARMRSVAMHVPNAHARKLLLPVPLPAQLIFVFARSNPEYDVRCLAPPPSLLAPSPSVELLVFVSQVLICMECRFAFRRRIQRVRPSRISCARAQPPCGAGADVSAVQT